MIDEYYTFKIYGYHSDELKQHSNKRVVAMCDECGLYRDVRMDKYGDMCNSCSNKDVGHKSSKTKLAQKEPLATGWTQKLSDITKNKECSIYLGSIAEVILSNIYNNVQVMPYANHGFDIICNKDFMIDVKSSATGDKRGYWIFNIKKNQIADYFLCIAFESRDDLHNPSHLWMIPGHIINHLSKLKISKSTIDKWQQYELSLNKLVACCDNFKERSKPKGLYTMPNDV